ncbi:MAG: HAMP domain-containing sensor histidine kinase [Planctomycetota bacterium]|nr:HAMP domain-containing sensor histidine kinase [Planctomycetota bacterium]
MQDLRAAPRWSKTAGIVVLVVFGLVLIVAVFGLWALTAQFDDARKDRLVKANADGIVLLKDVQAAIGRRLEGVVTRAYELHRKLEGDGWRERQDASRALQGYLEGPAHGQLASWVVRVDDARAVRWIGGRYRMWVRADDRIRIAALQDGAEGAQTVLRDEAMERRKQEGARAALEPWTELVSEYGLTARAPALDPDGALFPFGLGWTVQMVRAAADALGEDPTSLPPAVVRDVLLRAEEMLVLNGQLGRLPTASYEGYARDLSHQVRRLVAHTPDAQRESLVWERSEYRRVLAQLVDPRRGESLRAELFAERLQATRRRERRVTVAPQAAGLFGIYTLPDEQALIVSLDGAGVERMVQGIVNEQREAFDVLGMTALVFPAGKVPVGPDGMDEAASVDLTGPIHVPYRIAIFQTGQPAGIEDKYTSFLFWAVILLAGAGLCVGGYVLIRLLTREIRLAQLKADFVSNLSHELKTPITSISIFTEMLEDGKLTAPDDQAEAFAVIGQEIRRLQRIVMRMIDVARGEARTTPYTLAPGDLNRPVLEATTRFRRIITEPGLDLEIQLHPDILPVQMDVQAVDDVVTNLLSNAWKYKRGDKATIAVRTARRGRFAEIVVEDDGIGIPRAERRKVFDMFYRSEQYLTQPVAGTGLGLALVRSVVAGHKGRIELDAAQGGVGSVFTVRLPLDRAAAAALAASPASAAPDAPPPGKVVTS